jgi:hypothetical protein
VIIEKRGKQPINHRKASSCQISPEIAFPATAPFRKCLQASSPLKYDIHIC